MCLGPVNTPTMSTTDANPAPLSEDRSVKAAPTTDRVTAAASANADALLDAARIRVDALFITWPSWQRDSLDTVEQSKASMRRVMGDASLLSMARQALASDGHCAVDAPEAQIASLIFEQAYLNQMTTLSQRRKNGQGGHALIPAPRCQWERAAKLLPAACVAQLASCGLIVVDGALSVAELATARAAVAGLVAAGDLKVVARQANAGIRNDHMVALGSGHGGDPPPAELALATRLLCALPAEVAGRCSNAGPLSAQNWHLADTHLGCAAVRQVERHMEAAGVTGWRLAIPPTFQAAVYPGSEGQPASYCCHYDGDHDGSAPSNRRKLTVILYLQDVWEACVDGGCLRAHAPGGGGGYRDIEPLGGRLVLFDSTAIEHEVLPTFETRMALTLWAMARE